MYVVVGCSSTHNKLGLAPALFIIIIATIKTKKKGVFFFLACQR